MRSSNTSTTCTRGSTMPRCERHLYGTCPECESDYDDWTEDYSPETDRPHVTKEPRLPRVCDQCGRESSGPLCHRCEQNDRYEREHYL